MKRRGLSDFEINLISENLDPDAIVQTTIIEVNTNVKFLIYQY